MQTLTATSLSNSEVSSIRELCVRMTSRNPRFDPEAFSLALHEDEAKYGEADTLQFLRDICIDRLYRIPADVNLSRFASEARGGFLLALSNDALEAAMVREDGDEPMLRNMWRQARAAVISGARLSVKLRGIIIRSIVNDGIAIGLREMKKEAA